MKKFFLFVLLLGGGASAETVGELKINELTLRPEFLVREGQETEFSIDESMVGFRWQKSRRLSGQITLGSQSLRNTPVFYSDTPSTNSLGLLEAYGEYRGLIGDVRMGLLPVEFGIDGTRRESHRIFKRSLLFQNRVTALRDIGLRLSTSYDGFYTHLTVHNGEAGQDVDQQMWFTAKWGWTNDIDLNVGWSAQTGKTKAENTNSLTNTLAAVDNSLDATWRYGGLFLHWYGKNWEAVLEGYLGSVVQEDEESDRFYSAHLDVSVPLGKDVDLHLRHDIFEPNNKVDDDLQRQSSVGLSYGDRHETSTVYLLATKITEEDTQINNDELRLIWRLRPQVKPR